MISRITPSLVADLRRQEEGLKARLADLRMARSPQEIAVELVRNGAVAPLLMHTLAHRLAGSEVRS